MILSINLFIYDKYGRQFVYFGRQLVCTDINWALRYLSHLGYLADNHKLNPYFLQVGYIFFNCIFSGFFFSTNSTIAQIICYNCFGTSRFDCLGDDKESCSFSRAKEDRMRILNAFKRRKWTFITTQLDIWTSITHISI